jgi:hypothetical protein
VPTNPSIVWATVFLPLYHTPVGQAFDEGKSGSLRQASQLIDAAEKDGPFIAIRQDRL